jgi:NAD(P)-dependent dehydrogenase (short-subunit alcohol dehydrogenase family)
MNILLTGSNGGIGSVIKETLEKAGHTVIAVSRVDADLTSASSIKALKEKFEKENTKIDWVVCSHGFIDQETMLEQMTEANIENTFRVDILSIIYLAQQFLPLIPSGGGMVALSSSAGVNANGKFAPYSAAKAAVNTFMQALARNRSDKKFFAIAPGPTNTGMRNKVANDANNQQPPEAVANVIAELLAGKGEFKSGDVILVKSGAISTVSSI